VVHGHAVLIVPGVVARCGAGGGHGPRHADPAVEVVHLRLRARTACEVGVSTDGREVGRSSGEVVVGNRVLGGCVPAVAVQALLVGVARMEGRRVRVAAGGAGQTGVAVAVVVGGQPVDGGHPVVELARLAELPFAEDGPDDSDTYDATSDGKDGDPGGVGDGCCYAIRRVVVGGRRWSSGVTRDCDDVSIRVARDLYRSGAGARR